MTTNLASYIKQERIKHGLNYADLSRLMGYQNINKGMRRIINLERESKVHPEILMKIISTLKLDKDIVNELIRKDEEEYEKAFEEWANESTSMCYTIRMMPTIYLSYDLPTNIKNEDEAINYVSAVAREKRKLCWLNLSRKITVFINELGEVTGRHIRDALITYCLICWFDDNYQWHFSLKAGKLK